MKPHTLVIGYQLDAASSVAKYLLVTELGATGLAEHGYQTCGPDGAVYFLRGVKWDRIVLVPTIVGSGWHTWVPGEVTVLWDEIQRQKAAGVNVVWKL